jgi:2-dehydro-3-deoxygluconokinase
VRETLRLADWALPGLDDARQLFDTEDPAHIVGICHDLGASWVVLKLGRNGCVVSDGRRREHVAGVAIDAIDATGAGDCFDGAFAARATAGDDPFAAARFANAAAALATTGYGAVAPLPRVADVERLLAAETSR